MPSCHHASPCTHQLLHCYGVRFEFECFCLREYRADTGLYLKSLKLSCLGLRVSFSGGRTNFDYILLLKDCE